MKKSIVVAIIVAVAMIITGAVMSVCAYASLGKTYFEGKTLYVKDLEEDFSSVKINCKSENIWIFSSDDDVGRIEYSDYGNKELSVKVVNGVLEITSVEDLRWYEYISIVHHNPPRISLYLPYKEYKALSMDVISEDVYVATKIPFENVDIKTTSADIQFYGEVKESLSLESTSGDITITETNLNLKKASLKTVSGCIEANSIIASSEIDIKITSGEIEFNSIDAPEINLKSTSGDIEGNILTPKKIIAESTSGDIDVKSNDFADEICNVKTTSGDIKIRIG